MLISLNLLKELIIGFDKIALNQIINQLVLYGIEIKNVYKLCDATNLIVGQIIECTKIPDTHLNVCQINLGDEIGVKQIVCGAPNVRKDLKVIVALPGAKIIGKTIQSSVIRGTESYGMCCALSEICCCDKTFDDDKIYELSNQFKVGEKNIIQLLGFDDIILDIKLLANRPDLLSIYNLALELSVLFNCKFKPLVIDKSFVETKSNFKILNHNVHCSNFIIRIFNSINVQESPDELKKYLIAMGIKPINNIVDIGNYVMLLTGQPVNVYDLDKLPKSELIVQEGNGKFLALNQKEYELNSKDIVVNSGEKTVCLAGIIGSEMTKCDQKTKNVVIEIANFDSASIRHSSVALNLNTESSIRFVHGVNNQLKEVIELITFFVDKYCGFESVSNVISIGNIDNQPKKIKINVHEVNNILGTQFDLKSVVGILEKTYFQIDNINHISSSFDVHVPQHRSDIENVNDVAEEIIKFSNFSVIKSEFPSIQLLPGYLNQKQQKTIDIKKYLRNYLYEVLTYVLVNQKNIHLFTYLNNDEPYKLINPMSEDHLYLRKGLIPSLLNVVSYNIARQNKDFGVFEISNINTKNTQDQFLAIALTGCQKIQGYLNKIPYSFFSLKGFFKGIVDILGIDIHHFIFEEIVDNNELYPGKSAFIYFNKKKVGYLGELHPDVYRTFGIKNNTVLVMEINLNVLLDISNCNFKFIPFSRFPSVKRDLSLIVDSEVKIDTIINLVKQSGGCLVHDVNVFDLYKNENYQGKKSVSISIILLNPNATLKDEEIKLVMQKIQQSLEVKGISIRNE